MRFGLLGCGGIGSVHADLIAGLPDRARLVAVADAQRDAADILGHRAGARVYSGVEDLCAQDDVDAISICLPNGMHADAAVTALRAGKHVLIEKPIDVTLEAADRVLAAERASGRTVAVVSQRRFQPAFAFVHQAAAQGRLGRLTRAQVDTPFWRSQGYYDSASWRGTWAGEGGGALITQGSHALDLLVWMLGEPVRVSAFDAMLAHQRIEVEDVLSATIRFASGAIGTFSATTAAYPGTTVRLGVFGDAGTAVVENERLQYLHTRDAEPLRPAADDNDDRDDDDRDDDTNQAPEAGLTGDPGVDAAHGAQYADFIDAVETGRPPLVTALDGRRVLAVILAAYESASADGTPVDVHAYDPAAQG